MLEHLEKQYGSQEQYSHTNTLKGIINGVFVDFLKHDYNNVSDPLQIYGYQAGFHTGYCSYESDALKGNGTRPKDFIDIYFLLKEFSFGEIIGFYKLKCAIRSDFHAVKSLTCFDDVIVDEWPVMLFEKDLTFIELKKEILRKRDLFLKNQG